MKRFIFYAIGLFLVFLSDVSWALPSGAKVVSGSASINKNANILDITASNKAIINYDSFSIKQNEIVNFIQPSKSAVVLNRVIKANPSLIAGTINANGRVFLINPAGIIFTKNSSINTNSFLATTLDIKDSDFLKGSYFFKQNSNLPSGYILQQGDIKISPDGFVVLAAPFVKTDGLILAKSGKVCIGGVDNFYINFDQQGLVEFNYKPKNKPKTDMILSKEATDALVESVVNMDSDDEAINIVEKDGIVRLVGKNDTVLIDGNIKGKNSKVDIVANNDIKLTDNAKLQTDNKNITIFAQNNVYMSNKASLVAKNADIEFSAKKKVILDGGEIKCNMFYVDPQNIVISSDMILTSKYIAEASQSITLNDGIKIKSDNDIFLYSPNITLKTNSSIYSKNGNVILKTTATQNADKYTDTPKSAVISIQDGVSIEANNIDIIAVSNHKANFKLDSAKDGLTNIDKTDILESFTNLPITPIAYEKAQSTSKIDIQNATIKGKNITIKSQSRSSASVSALFKMVSIAYGNSISSSDIEINNGSIEALGNINIYSKASGTNHVGSIASNVSKDNSQKKSNQNDISLAFSKTNIDSNIKLNTNIDAKGDLTISSNIYKNIKTSASALSYSNATLGTAFSMSKSSSSADAKLLGNVNAKSIHIDAVTQVDRIQTNASSSVGNGLVAKLILEIAKDKIKDIVSEVKDKTQAQTTNKQRFSLSAAAAISKHTNNTKASIGKNAIVSSTDGDIEINADTFYTTNALLSNDDSGDLRLIYNKGIKTSAIATIDSTQKNEKQNAFSGSVAFSDIKNSSEAYIDDDAIVNSANDVNVFSNIILHYNLQWSNMWPLDDKTFFTFGRLIGSGLKLLEDSIDLTNFRGELFTSFSQSNAGGSDNSMAGSFNVFNMKNDSSAYIGENVIINQVSPSYNNVNIYALVDTQTINFAGIIGWTTYVSKQSEKSAVGGSYLDVNFANSVEAYISKNSIINTSSLSVEAEKYMHNISLATAGGMTNGLSFNGSYSSMTTDDKTDAHVKNAIITLDNLKKDTQVVISANNNTKNLNGSGGVSKGKNIGVGLSASITNATRDTRAYMQDTKLKVNQNGFQFKMDSDNEIKAQNSGNFKTFALSGSYTSKTSSIKPDEQTSNRTGAKYGVGVSGDASVNKISDTAQAYIKNSNFIAHTQDFNIFAQNTNIINAYSGAVNITLSKKSFGLAGAFASNEANTNIGAYIENSTIKAYQSDIEAKNNIQANCIDGSGTITPKGVGLAGAVSINKSTNQIKAYVDETTDFSAIKDITINAVDKSKYRYYTGALGAGKFMGLGLSYAQNLISSSIFSYIKNSSISSQNLYVKALQDYDIFGLSGTASVALGTMAISGSYGENSINNVTNAHIFNSQIATKDISIIAKDNTKLDLHTGELSGSASTAVGISGTRNEIKNNIHAYTQKLTHLKSSNFDTMIINASSNKSLRFCAVGGGGSGFGSAMGGVLINNIADDIQAKVLESVFKLDNSLKLMALQNNTIETYGGTISGSGTFGIGGSLVANNISSSIEAFIENSTIDAWANKSISVPNKDSDNFKDMQEKNGIYILALADEDLKSYVANLNGTGSISGVGSLNFSDFENTLDAHISNSTINKNATQSKQDVVLRSISNTNYNIKTGGASFGSTLGVGGSLTKLTNRINTYSYIDNSFVKAQNLIETRAQTKDRVNALTISGAISGATAMAGNVFIADIQNTNSAKIVNNSILKSNKNINIIAKDKVYMGYDRNDKRTSIFTGAGGLSGEIGVAGSVAINNIKNNSYAHIDDSDVNAKEKIYLFAYNYAKMANYGLSGALGSLSGNGITIINTIDSDTKAYTHHNTNKDVKLNQDKDYVNDKQNINIEAVDYINMDDTLGSASVGIGAVGGSLEFTTLKNNTQAYFGKETLAFAKKDISIKARSVKKINTKTIGGTTGGLSIGGSVNILNIGSSISQNIKMISKNTGIAIDRIAKGVKKINLGFFKNTSVQNKLNDGSSIKNYKNVFDYTPNITNKTQAFINDNANINAGQLLNIEAINTLEKLHVDSGGVNLGAVGVGGSAALVYLGAQNKAFIGDGCVVYFKDLTLNSLYNIDDVIIKSYAGSVGVVTFGADDSRVVNSYANTISIGELSDIVAQDSITIKSITHENINARAYGASIGGAAVGSSSAKILSKGLTKNSFGKESNIFTRDGDINILARYFSNSNAYVKSGAVSLLSADISHSKVNINPSVDTIFEKSAIVRSGGDLNILGSSKNKISAKTYGANLSGAKIGGNFAEAYNRALVTTDIQDLVILNANKSVRIFTYENIDDNSQRIKDNSITAYASSSTGSLIGATGSSSKASSHSHLVTNIGKNAVINAKKYTTIKTKTFANTDAGANGKVFGIMAFGATLSKTFNDGDVYLNIDDGAKIFSQDNILIQTYAKKNATSKVTGGRGGALSVGGTKSSINLGNINHINIQDDVKLYSQKNVTIKSSNNIYSKSYTKNISVGTMSKDYAKSTITLNKQDAKISINKAKIVGENVYIEANTPYLYLSSEAYDKTIATASHSHAQAYLTSNSNAQVDIDKNTNIIGYENIDIEANQHTDDVFLRTTATATISPSVVGKLYATVQNDPTFTSTINIGKTVTLESKNITIKGSSPNMKKPNKYPRTYNYVKYPHIINHSITYYVEEYVWKLIDCVWQWVKVKTKKHKNSFSQAVKRGKFISDKTINIAKKAKFNKAPDSKQKDAFMDNFNKQQAHYYTFGYFVTKNGILNASSWPPILQAAPPVRDEFASLLNANANSNIFADQSLKNKDIEDITQIIPAISNNYLKLNYKFMLQNANGRKFIIINNQMLGGRAYESYQQLQKPKFLPVVKIKQNIKNKKENNLISIN